MQNVRCYFSAFCQKTVAYISNISIWMCSLISRWEEYYWFLFARYHAKVVCFSHTRVTWTLVYPFVGDGGGFEWKIVHTVRVAQRIFHNTNNISIPFLSRRWNHKKNALENCIHQKIPEWMRNFVGSSVCHWFKIHISWPWRPFRTNDLSRR